MSIRSSLIALFVISAAYAQEMVMSAGRSSITICRVSGEVAHLGTGRCRNPRSNSIFVYCNPISLFRKAATAMAAKTKGPAPMDAERFILTFAMCVVTIFVILQSLLHNMQ